MRRFVPLWFVLLALIGCGQPAQPPPRSPTATPAAGAPSAAARWQPPVPHPQGPPLPQPLPPRTAIPGNERAGLRVDDGAFPTVLSIRDTGLVILSDHSVVMTMTLSLSEHDQLAAHVAALSRVTLESSYSQRTPVTPTRPQYDRHLTVSNRRITLRGATDAPRALLALEQYLRTIADRVRTDGWRPPVIRLGYYLRTNDPLAQYLMEIDAAGTIFVGHSQQPVGTLPAGELEDLLTGLSPHVFAQWQEWYFAPPATREHPDRQATIAYLPRGKDSYSINMLTGATIPPKLQALLSQLTDIYSRYGPPE